MSKPARQNQNEKILKNVFQKVKSPFEKAKVEKAITLDPRPRNSGPPMGVKKLSYQEKEFILDNTGKLSDVDIAKKLNRPDITIRSAQKRMGIKKPKAIKDELDTEKKGKRKYPPKYTRAYFKQALTNSFYYKTLQEQLTPRELEYYIEAWSDLGTQFSDIIATEQRQIDELIKAEIMGNRILKSIKLASDEVELLAQEIDKLRADPKATEDEQLQQKDELIMTFVQRLHSVTQALSNDYNKNQDMKRKITEDLNARRKDRTEQLKNVGSTFLSMVEAFKEAEVREAQGKHLELLKMAKDKKLAEWHQKFTFPDGEQDSIILDTESEIVNDIYSPDLLENPRETDIKGVEDAAKS